jgi:hypothetical protein
LCNTIKRVRVLVTPYRLDVIPEEGYAIFGPGKNDGEGDIDEVKGKKLRLPLIYTAEKDADRSMQRQYYRY